MLTQAGDRRQVHGQPAELVTDRPVVEAPETGLHALAQSDDGGLGMGVEITPSAAVERKRTQCQVLPVGRQPECAEVDIDRVDEADRHRVVKDAVAPTGLAGPAPQGHHRRLRQRKDVRHRLRGYRTGAESDVRSLSVRSANPGVRTADNGNPADDGSVLPAAELVALQPIVMGIN